MNAVAKVLTHKKKVKMCWWQQDKSVQIMLRIAVIVVLKMEWKKSLTKNSLKLKMEKMKKQA